jgi:hypothetical protein
MRDMSSIVLADSIQIHALQTGTVAIKEHQRNGNGDHAGGLLELVRRGPTLYVPSHDREAVARLMNSEVAA